MNLRALAAGKPCMVRIHGVCNHDPLTTILAHYRLSGICGVGMKPIDLCAAYACSDCHDAIDRRTHLELEYEYVRHAHAEGCLRTLALLAKEGILS